MMQNRILYSNNGVITDITTGVSRYESGNASIASFVATEDAIYIGTYNPFNHVYVKFNTANVNPANLSLSYWEGTEFVPVVEINDETSGLTSSGFITFVPDKDEGWIREDTNSNGNQVTGLSSVTIYDRFWLKIESDADLSAIDIAWVGQKFTDDNDLGTEYPELNRQVFKDSFENGKTNWEAQHVRAAELVVQDMITRGIIHDGNQILVRDQLKLITICKVAEIIFAGLGDDYIDDKRRAKDEYESRLRLDIFKVDRTKDGVLDVFENERREGFMSR